MSLSAKNITQGGQVAAYNLRMYFQINNWIGFWSFVLLVGVALILMVATTPLEIIQNGSWYWFANINQSFLPLAAGSEKAFDIHFFYAATSTTYTVKMTLSQMLVDRYMLNAGDVLLTRIEIASAIGGAVAFAFFMVVTWYLGHKGKEQSEDEFISGQELSTDPVAVTKLLKSENKASDLRIGKLAMLLNAEMQNFGMHGTVGTGKSTVMRELLDGIRKRGDRVIIYDSGCTFVETHYRDGIDTILNPYDERCANWDLWGECSSMPDYDNMANSLIPIEGDTTDPFWVSSARTIFAATAMQMSKDADKSIEKFLRVLLSISIKNLRAFLDKTEAASLVEEKIEKTAISIRSVITNYVKALRYLQGLDKKGKDKFTIRDWMMNPDKAKSWLFISANAQQKSSLRPLISMWISLATINLLSMDEDYNRRVWFFIDELPGLQKLPELPGVMAEARKFGGCFVLGMQNMPQLIQIYGKNMGASINDLLNTRIFFRSPSAEVAKQVEGELGKQRRKEARQQFSYGPDPIRDGVSMSKQSLQEPIVDYDEIMRLEDLTFFIRFPGEYPVVRMQLARKPSKKINKGLLLRNFNESLNPDIEAMVQQNEITAVAAGVLFEETNKKEIVSPEIDEVETTPTDVKKEKPEPVEPKWNIHEIEPDTNPESFAVVVTDNSLQASPIMQPTQKPKALSRVVSEAKNKATSLPFQRLNQAKQKRLAAAQDDAQNDGNQQEKVQRIESDEDPQDTAAKVLKAPLLSAKQHLSEDEKQKKNQSEHSIDAMMDDEKDILRHHKPDETGYTLEMNAIGGDELEL